MACIWSWVKWKETAVVFVMVVWCSPWHTDVSYLFFKSHILLLSQLLLLYLQVLSISLNVGDILWKGEDAVAAPTIDQAQLNSVLLSFLFLAEEENGTHGGDSHGSCPNIEHGVV